VFTRSFAVLAVLAAMSASFGYAAGAAAARPVYGDPPLGPGTAGPPYRYPTAVVGQGDTIPLKNRAIIVRTEHGYRYQAGQQNSHLVITRTDSGSLRFRDTGTQRLWRIPSGCHRQRANPGIAGVCGVPSDISTRRPLLIEVWPRLGGDYVDTHTLPATFATSVLGDKGSDTVLFGAGPDFFNGFVGRDRVRGGGGKDWIRSGKYADRVFGSSGNDQIVDSRGSDFIAGGEGADHIWAGPGNDRVDARAGTDRVVCSSGHDRVWVLSGDSLSQCERVYRG
jgi:Ca2+-binding RTX toxin-like protein